MRVARTCLAVSLAAVACLPALAAGPAPGSFSSASTTGACASVPCQRWLLTYQGSENQSALRAIAVSPDGSKAFLVGADQTVATFTDLVTAAVDVRTGAVLWSQRYDDPVSSDEADLHSPNDWHVAVSPDGGTVVVAATSHGGFDDGYDVATLAYRVRDGTPLWTARTGVASGTDEAARGVAIDPSNQVVLVAADSVAPGGGRDSALVAAYGLRNGTEIWSRVFSSCSFTHAFGVAAPAATGLAVVGGFTSDCLASPAPAAVGDQTVEWLQYAAGLDLRTGDTAWWTQDPRVDGQLDSVLKQGELDVAGGRVFVTGAFTAPGNPDTDFDVVTFATDTAGHRLWTARYDSLGDDLPRRTAVAADGSRLYVVASTASVPTTGVADQNLDAVVYALEGATGSTVWTDREDSSTDGLRVAGRGVGGSADDVPNLQQPALAGTTLILSYDATDVPLVGAASATHHVVALLDTRTGLPMARRISDDVPADSFAAVPRHAVFLSAAWRGDWFSPTGVAACYALTTLHSGGPRGCATDRGL